MTDALLRATRVGSRPELCAALVMLLSYPALLATALLGYPGLFAVAGAASYLADQYLHHRHSYLINRLSKARAGLSLRFLVRQFMLVLLLLRVDGGEPTLTVAAVVCFLLFYGVQAPHSTLTTLLRNRLGMPLHTRNIDLSGLGIPDAPPRLLLHRSVEKLQHLDVAAVVGVLAAVTTGETGYGYVGMALTLILGTLYCGAVALFLRSSKLPPASGPVLEWFDDWLRDHRPTTVLYFSGSADSTYQVNMWLGTLRELSGRPLVILRERHTLARLAPTSLPVVCVPSAVHLMNMDLSMVRVALYPANVGKNIHLLRVPTMKHAFVGHGDSDKAASINPYSKVYDEVWTAGKAGRDRYALANVGVRDDSVVEVGRPQLEPIHHGRRRRSDGDVTVIPTVLYAPTWEGWTDDPGNTSLLLAGENIVRHLVTANPPVRVLYRPHPFTGMRSPRARATHQRIVALLEDASRRRAAQQDFGAHSEREQSAHIAARGELAQLAQRLGQLTRTAEDGADDAARSATSLTDPAREAELSEARAGWNDAYWRSFPWWEHRVVSGSDAGLYDCFNQSDALVSDISSVVSDFLASGKPYAVTDSAGLGPAEFTRRNTAVRAAVVLANDAQALDTLLDAVHDEAEDSLARTREELKRYLLGPGQSASMERFDSRVRALAERAEAANARRLAPPRQLGPQPERGARDTAAALPGDQDA